MSEPISGAPCLEDPRDPQSPQLWDAFAVCVKSRAAEFAALTAEERVRLLRECVAGTHKERETWVRASCAAKGIDFDSHTSGEEWFGGPDVVIRNCRLLAESWEKFGAGGMPHDDLPMRTRANGLKEIDVFPANGYDKALFGGFTATVVCEAMTDQSGPASVPKGGRTCLVLGAGNVSSIPAMDVLYKMFVEGRTCVLKMNPVNAYVGPSIERAFASLIQRGFLRVAYGGAEAGKFLCEHASIDELHITGSDKTHDLIVWGADPAERDRRKADRRPLLNKPITSELGNVSPVIVVPGEYREEELDFMAKNVASMVANNASCNCNAAKMLVTSSDWPQRREFLTRVHSALTAIPCRVPYYPGATERYARLTDRTDGVTFVGGGKGRQPWALIAGLDSTNEHEPLFSTEPFCAILSETTVPGADIGTFLPAAVRFCNEHLWGTLNASVMIDPRTEASEAGVPVLKQAIDHLDYGTVAINHWPALGYGFVSPPWGAAPGNTLTDVGSGIGWVHNTFMLRGIRKSIIRGPLTVKPKPAWFADNKVAHIVGRKLADFEAAPSWLKVPGIAATALRG